MSDRRVPICNVEHAVESPMTIQVLAELVHPDGSSRCEESVRCSTSGCHSLFNKRRGYFTVSEGIPINEATDRLICRTQECNDRLVLMGLITGGRWYCFNCDRLDGRVKPNLGRA